MGTPRYIFSYVVHPKKELFNIPTKFCREWKIRLYSIEFLSFHWDYIPRVIAAPSGSFAYMLPAAPNPHKIFVIIKINYH